MFNILQPPETWCENSVWRTISTDGCTLSEPAEAVISYINEDDNDEIALSTNARVQALRQKNPFEHLYKSTDLFLWSQFFLKNVFPKSKINKEPQLALYGYLYIFPYSTFAPGEYVINWMMEICRMDTHAHKHMVDPHWRVVGSSQKFKVCFGAHMCLCMWEEQMCTAPEVYHTHRLIHLMYNRAHCRPSYMDDCLSIVWGKKQLYKTLINTISKYISWNKDIISILIERDIKKKKLEGRNIKREIQRAEKEIGFGRESKWAPRCNEFGMLQPRQQQCDRICAERRQKNQIKLDDVSAFCHCKLLAVWRRERQYSITIRGGVQTLTDVTSSPHLILSLYPERKFAPRSWSVNKRWCKKQRGSTSFDLFLNGGQIFLPEQKQMSFLMSHKSSDGSHTSTHFCSPGQSLLQGFSSFFTFTPSWPSTGNPCMTDSVRILWVGLIYSEEEKEAI